MGTSLSAAQFSDKIVKAATITERRQRLAVDRGAFAVKTIIIAEAGAKGVSPASRIAKGKWGVRYDVRGVQNPTALVRIYGPFHLVDRPTAPHRIAPRRRGRRSSGKRALSFNGMARASAQHPGTRGKGIFEASKAKAQRTVPGVMGQSIVSGWREAFR